MKKNIFIKGLMALLFSLNLSAMQRPNGNSIADLSVALGGMSINRIDRTVEVSPIIENADIFQYAGEISIAEFNGNEIDACAMAACRGFQVGDRICLVNGRAPYIHYDCLIHLISMFERNQIFGVNPFNYNELVNQQGLEPEYIEFIEFYDIVD